MRGLDSATDEELAALASSGDRAAFEKIVHRRKEQVFRFVRRYVGSSDDAYDIVQEAFLAAWIALPRYDPGRPFSPWFHRIALNKCRDFSRRQTVRKIFLMLWAKGQGDASTNAEPPVDPQTEHLQQLDRAIAELPAFYKEPLVLTVFSGLSHQEAANVLKTTPKAIELRVRRARKKLADAMPRSEREG